MDMSQSSIIICSSGAPYHFPIISRVSNKLTINCKTVLDDNIESNSALPTKRYDLFRKKFYIPSKWASKQEFIDLASHTYATENAVLSLEFIRSRLEALGYLEDNDTMIHDYLHYTIIDLLVEERIPFLTEDDLRKSSSLATLFQNMTPDLVIKSNPSKGRLKPMILDVYVGNNEKQINDKKSKYKSLQAIFEFSIATRHNFRSILQGILTTDHINYLASQYQIFITEYTYWRACIKLQMILVNDVENIPIRELSVSKGFPEDLQQDIYKLSVALSKKAMVILDNTEC